MNISVYFRTYNSYGGHNVFSMAGKFIEMQLPAVPDFYGSAIDEFEIIACFPDAAKEPDPAPEKSMFENFQEFVKSLPKATFYRKKRRIVAIYQSNASFSTELKAEPVNAALKEILEILELATKKIKKSDNFDTSRFLADVGRIVQTGVASDDEARKIKVDASARHAAKVAATDPWDMLDIQWTDYHPQARTILNDLYYWDCVDDLAPHGTDTGADLLDDYKRWRRRNPRGTPMNFLTKLVASWSIESIDWKILDPVDVSRAIEEDKIAFRLCQEAIIALAFAEIKLLGKCDQEVLSLAIRAIDRELLPIEMARGFGQAERKQIYEKMKGKLMQVQQSV